MPAIHLHCLVLHGVYRRGADGTPEFVEAPAPTDEALQTLLHEIISRTMKLLTRRGVLVEEEEERRDSSRTCAPTSMVSACTQPCAARPTTGTHWSNCAATSPGAQGG